MSRLERKILITPADWSPPAGAQVIARATATIEGLPISLATVEGSAPPIEPDDREVVVRVLAFSCNYRDKSWSLHLAGEAEKHHRSFAFGSDFAGEVVAVGRKVTGFAPGDRVIGNNDYPSGGGLATQEASAGTLRLPAEHLVKIPTTMNLAAAASFGVSAQTAYGMVRRSELLQAPGNTRVLVTAGTSSTSLAVLGAIRGVAADVTTISTSMQKSERLRALQPGNILTVSREKYSENLRAALESDAQARGPFTHVFDPFCDIHFPLVLEHMAMDGRYVTCGFFRQHNSYPEIENVDHRRAWQALIAGNLIIRGNCLGSRADLETALAEHAAGVFTIPLDSHYSFDRPAEFLLRTYGEPQKFGKVVCRLE